MGGPRDGSRGGGRPPRITAGGPQPPAWRPVQAAWGAGGAKAAGLPGGPEGRPRVAGYGPARRRRPRPDCVGSGAVGRGGVSRHGPLARRDTLQSQAFRRRRLNSTLKSLLFWILLIVVGVMIWQFSNTFQRSENQMAFSTFLTHVEKDQVASVVITGNEITGALTTDSGGDGNPKFRTYAPTQYEGLANRLADHHVAITAKPETTSPWATLLYSWAPILLMIGFWLFIMRQMQSGGNKALSFGKSRAKLSSSSQKKVTFKDVSGVDEAKEELQEIIEFLKEPQKFQKLGGRIPKGVLLMGPPGTGKTLLARAVAGEANVPFFSISGSDFVEMFVGVGASRVRDLFEQGKKNAPCIVFIDEIDAVGRHRGAGLGGGHDEREQTLNQLLVEMDCFDSADGVILVAATNRPDVLDPALLRPGRFDRRVVVPRPDIK